MKDNDINIKEEVDKMLEDIARKFFIFFTEEWQKSFCCPECGCYTLDLAKPALNLPIICSNCHTLFDLVSVRKEEKE